MDSGGGSEELLRQAVLPGNCRGCVAWAEKLHRWRCEVLLESAEAGHVECVEALLAAEVDVNTRDYKVEDALMTASRQGHSDCVDLLVRAGADVNGQWEVTSIAHAAMNGHARCVDLLIQAGAAVNHLDPSPLQCAAKNGHLKCAEFLVQAGADVNAGDPPYNRTPLISAAENGHDRCVSFLIEAGADVDEKGDMMVVLRAYEPDATRCVELFARHTRFETTPSDPPLFMLPKTVTPIVWTSFFRQE